MIIPVYVCLICQVQILLEIMKNTKMLDVKLLWLDVVR